MSNPIKLNIAHFNDVYQVSEQSVKINGKREKIDVTKFAASLESIKSGWKKGSDGEFYEDGLVLFSGDLLSPSIESSTTRGAHMPSIMKALGVDVSVIGNHEFDFGYPHLLKTLKDAKSEDRVDLPWLLSNIIDTETGKVPEPMVESHIIEKAGIRIGFIGLVEKDWIPMITEWPENFKHHDMAEIGKALSAKLRDPAGEYKCDFVIALTHCFTPNDIKLARDLFALSPAAQKTTNIASEHGVDLVLGGHNHYYWVSKGVTSWDGYDPQTFHKDAKDDRGDVLIVKSGTNFQDLSGIVLTLVDAPAGSIRRKVIQEIRGSRHVTREHLAAHAPVQAVVKKELETLELAWAQPACITEVELDVTKAFIRSQESPVANWITDCLRPAYDDKLAPLGYPTTDGVIFVTGSFAQPGIGIYDAGTTMTIKDIVSILPNTDPAVVVELSGNDIWDALEIGLVNFPKAGSFPAISGLRVVFDSSKPEKQRVVGVWLLAESKKIGVDGKPILVDKEEITRDSTRKYLIMVGEFMVDGGDGYGAALGGRKLIINGESGQNKATLMRDIILGTHELNKTELQESNSVVNHTPIKRSPASSPPGPANGLNSMMVSNSIAPRSWGRREVDSAQDFTPRVAPTPAPVVSKQLVSAALKAVKQRDVGLLDGYARQRARMAALDRAKALQDNALNGLQMNFAMFGGAAMNSVSPMELEERRIEREEKIAIKTLPRIHPVVDGRLKDIAKSS